MKQLLLGLLLTMAASGCASGTSGGSDKPLYMAPELPKAEAAVVRGKMGTYVVSVDGAHVKGSGLQLANFGGNSVVLAPGKHKLEAHNEHSSGNNNYGHQQGLTLSVQGPSICVFEVDFQAGHEYVVGPKSLLNTDLELQDKTANLVFEHP